MNDNEKNNPKPENAESEEKKHLSRRQFLTYALGGTAAFMATMVASPLIVEAFDPLHRNSNSTFFKTSWKPSDFNEKLPTHVTFDQKIPDAWDTHDMPNDVYVIVYQKKLMIMSHVCTHLGCHVNGSIVNGKSVPPEYNHNKDWFECPCHGSLYNIYGVPTPTSPAPRPLDLFYYRINAAGNVEVGGTFQRTKDTWDYNPNPEITL